MLLFINVCCCCVSNGAVLCTRVHGCIHADVYIKSHHIPSLSRLLQSPGTTIQGARFYLCPDDLRSTWDICGLQASDMTLGSWVDVEDCDGSEDMDFPFRWTFPVEILNVLRRQKAACSSMSYCSRICIRQGQHALWSRPGHLELVWGPGADKERNDKETVLVKLHSGFFFSCFMLQYTDNDSLHTVVTREWFCNMVLLCFVHYSLRLQALWLRDWSFNPGSLSVSLCNHIIYIIY